MNHQYDVIVIGTGEKTKSAVRALSEQGQQVMYIELLPEMLTTMVCHRPKKNTSSQEFHPSKEQNQMKTKIHIQKQTVKTSAGETITYTFHVEESVEIREVERVESDEPIHEEWDSQQPYLFHATNQSQSNVEPLKFDLIDDFIDKMNQSSSEPKIDDHFYFEEESSSNDQEEESIFYEIDEEPIKKEEETIDFIEEIQSIDNEEVKHEEVDDHVIHSMNHTLKPSTLSQQKERENELREKLIRRKDQSETTNLLTTSEYQTQDLFEEQEDHIQPIFNEKDEEMDRSAFLQSVLNKPSYSPRESRLRKRLTFKPKIYQTSEQKNETNLSFLSQSSQQEEQDHQENQKVYSFEPFSSRRRARAQKKNRMLTNIQQSHSTDENQQLSSIQEEVEHLESSGSQQSFLEESSSKQQPYVMESSSKQSTGKIHTIEPNQSQLSMGENASSDLLKKDDIEIEDPYGGYDSLEDFFPRGRKRQEMDEIEKRKIALRGLHNLINNLG